MTLTKPASRLTYLAALIASFALYPVATAIAAPSASGSAYDVSINLSLAGIISFDVAPQNAISFSGTTSAWSDATQSGPLDVGIPLVHVGADALSVSGQWIPSDGFLIVGTQATADHVGLDTLGTSAGLLSLSATQIQATAIIGGTCSVTARSKTSRVSATPVDDFIFFDAFESAGLSSVGGTDNSGLTVSVEGTPLLGLPDAPAPNTSFALPAGIGTLVLNETIVGGDGNSNLSTSTNALHLTLSALGLITGDVVIAHADASISCF